MLTKLASFLKLKRGHGKVVFKNPVNLVNPVKNQTFPVSSGLFVTQGFDGVETGGEHGGPVTEPDADRHGKTA
jgi:hypothetical protein